MRRIWNGVIVAAAALAAITTHAAFGQSATGSSPPSTLNANPTPQATQASARAAQQAALVKMQAHGEDLFNARCKGCHMPPVEHAPSRKAETGSPVSERDHRGAQDRQDAGDGVGPLR